MAKNHILISAALVSTLAITGCQSTNPYTGESQNSKATNGAIIGSIAGAVIGAASSSKKDRFKGALIGAGVGGAAGAGVGYYMDKQEEKLRQQLQGTGVSVTRQGDQILLNMPNALTFDTNGTTLSNDAKEVLYSVTLVAQEYKDTKLEVIGHTDSQGSDSYNLNLSEVRAMRVADLLRTQIDTARVASFGMGEKAPVADNKTSSGRAQNRRVEIKLRPLQS